MLLLARLETLEPEERLPLPPTLLGRLARRFAQVVTMQHHALAVEGQHDDRPLGKRLAPGRAARLVERVEVLGRASHQLVRLTLGHFGPGTTRQVEQRFVERPRGGTNTLTQRPMHFKRDRTHLDAQVALQLHWPDGRCTVLITILMVAGPWCCARLDIRNGARLDL